MYANGASVATRKEVPIVLAGFRQHGERYLASPAPALQARPMQVHTPSRSPHTSTDSEYGCMGGIYDDLDRKNCRTGTISPALRATNI
jgi:hypothetical protein